MPVWNPDKTVVHYLGDFVPAKKLKSAVNGNQVFNYPCNTVNCNISNMGIGSDKTLNVPRRHKVSASSETDIKSKIKVNTNETNKI